MSLPVLFNTKITYTAETWHSRTAGPSERVPVLACAACCATNMHSCYFAARIVSAHSQARRQHYYSTFSLVRGCHSSLQSVPLAILLGVDVLLELVVWPADPRTAPFAPRPSRAAAAVKISSLALSLLMAGLGMVLPFVGAKRELERAPVRPDRILAVILGGPAEFLTVVLTFVLCFHGFQHNEALVLAAHVAIYSAFAVGSGVVLFAALDPRTVPPPQLYEEAAHAWVVVAPDMAQRLRRSARARALHAAVSAVVFAPFWCLIDLYYCMIPNPDTPHTAPAVLTGRAGRLERRLAVFRRATHAALGAACVALRYHPALAALFVAVQALAVATNLLARAAHRDAFGARLGPLEAAGTLVERWRGRKSGRAGGAPAAVAAPSVVHDDAAAGGGCLGTAAAVVVIDSSSCSSPAAAAEQQAPAAANEEAARADGRRAEGGEGACCSGSGRQLRQQQGDVFFSEAEQKTLRSLRRAHARLAAVAALGADSAAGSSAAAAAAAALARAVAAAIAAAQGVLFTGDDALLVSFFDEVDALRPRLRACSQSLAAAGGDGAAAAAGGGRDSQQPPSSPRKIPPLNVFSEDAESEGAAAGAAVALAQEIEALCSAHLAENASPPLAAEIRAAAAAAAEAAAAAAAAAAAGVDSHALPHPQPPAAEEAEDKKAVPLHGVAFRHAIDTRLWLSQDSTCREDCEHGGCSYALSSPVAFCDFFISHRWSDDARSKVELMRRFAFLLPFYGTCAAFSLVTTVMVVPGGLALESVTGGALPWWSVSLCCAGGGAAAALWALASDAGVVPGALAPWALTSKTFWLDKCCIDQSSEAARKAGIAHLGDSLHRSRNLLVLFSPMYLTRLWCARNSVTAQKSSAGSNLVSCLQLSNTCR